VQLALGGVRLRARWLLAFVVLAFFASSSVLCSTCLLTTLPWAVLT
jgi:hypothetical protein